MSTPIDTKVRFTAEAAQAIGEIRKLRREQQDLKTDSVDASKAMTEAASTIAKAVSDAAAKAQESARAEQAATRASMEANRAKAQASREVAAAQRQAERGSVAAAKAAAKAVTDAEKAAAAERVRVAKETATAQKQAAKEAADAQKKAAKEAAEAEKSAANFRKAITFGATAYGLREIVGLIRAVATELLGAQVQAEKLRSGLLFASDGNMTKALQELGFVSRVAKDLGLELDSTATQYLKLTAAAKGTSLEGENTRRIFQAIAKAATALNLSADETGGALLAIQQMISKGKVSAEELSGQLGERLPGALQITARALGVTTAQLFKMMEAGELTATDLLPKLADQLEKEFAPSAARASQGTQQSINRVSTAWMELKKAFADSGPAEAMKGSLDGLTKVLDGVAAGMRRAKSEGSGFLGQLAGGLGGAIGVNGSNSYADLLKQQNQLNTSLEKMKASWAASTLYGRQIYETEAKLAAVQVEIARRKREAGPTEAPTDGGDAETSRTRAQAEKAQNARSALRKLVDDARDDREKIADERKKFVEQYKGILSPAELEEAEVAFAKRMDKKAGNRLDRVAQVKLLFDRELELTLNQIERQKKINQESFDDGLIDLQAYIDTRTRLEEAASAQEIARLEKELAQRRQVLATNQARLGTAPDASSRETLREAIVQQTQEIAKGETEILEKKRDQLDADRERSRVMTENLRQLSQQLLDIDLQINEAQGKPLTEADIRARVRAAYDPLLREMSKMPGGAEKVNQLIDLKVTEQQLAELQRQYQVAFDAISLIESKAVQDQQAGVITVAEAEQRVLDARREQLPVLDEILTKMKDLASTPAQRNQVEQTRQQVGALRDMRTEMGKLAEASAKSGLADFLTEVETGSKSAGEALRDMVSGFAKALLNLINQRLAEKFINSFMGTSGGGTSTSTSGSGSGSENAGWIQLIGTIFSSLYHTGGVVGQGGGMGRSVSPEVFRMAPRYHSGGVAGLRPNEQAAVLLKGEEVLTEDDPRHVKNGGRVVGGVQVSNSVTVQGADGGSTDQRAAAGDLIQMMNATIDTWAAKQSRPGGILARS